MKVLVLNCGSSSLKYQLFDATDESVLAKGRVERIGIDGSFLVHKGSGDEITVETAMPDHTVAIQNVLNMLTDEKYGVIKSFDEIGAVGHRVVHGGEDFSGSVLITEAVKASLTRNIELAPLHNPPNLMGIEAVEAAMPGVPNIGVFDTAFHSTMPKFSYLYALPYSLYEKYKIRRYGFHGTSHKFVSQRCAVIMGKPIETLKIITAHLGNGCSLTAVDGGKSVDTSMGFTPLEGVMMGTRSGDFDPAIVGYVMQKENMSFDEFSKMVNKDSGMLGITGISSDMRDVETAADAGNERALLGLDMFEYQIRKTIGSFVAVLNGVDALVFTAGIGENDAVMRSKICSHLGWLGVEIDENLNNNRKIKEKEISTANSKIRVFVIPTNEELAIARDTYAIVTGKMK
ncbi:MAG: acetate kinase [Negativicutes bacterium]|nr:acetate kinase [Negativicutes bacterium]